MLIKASLNHRSQLVVRLMTNQCSFAWREVGGMAHIWGASGIVELDPLKKKFPNVPFSHFGLFKTFVSVDRSPNFIIIILGPIKLYRRISLDILCRSHH